MNKKPLAAAAAVMLAGLFLACCSGSSPSELQVKDIEVGTGDQAIKGSTLTVHYTGWLFVNGRRGKQFDSSLGGSPLSFKLGAGEVIEGWDRGLEGMKVGGKRDIIIPPHLGYGKPGAPPDIPPDATLNFEVQLLSVGKNTH